YVSAGAAVRFSVRPRHPRLRAPAAPLVRALGLLADVASLPASRPRHRHLRRPRARPPAQRRLRPVLHPRRTQSSHDCRLDGPRRAGPGRPPSLYRVSRSPIPQPVRGGGVMAVCRSVDEIRAAALNADNPPLSQELADYLTALLAPHRGDKTAA